MSGENTVAVKINQDLCSRCMICYSICPFEAITYEEEGENGGKLEIDIEKCQVCGICYSACPSLAIEIEYYDWKALVELVKQLRKQRESSTLVLMCRGNSPSTCEVQDILRKERLNIQDYIALRVPCAGRIPTEFVLGVLKNGIDAIVAIQCEEDFCRFKEGSRINKQRLLLTRKVLRQLGFAENALRLLHYSRKAVYETEDCVGCDKCVFICPYDAIEAEPLSTPKIIEEKCVGCGACMLVCPHLAIQLEGFEFKKVFSLIQRYGNAARKMKENGVSPTVLVFCCQWSEFSALDNPESSLFDHKAVALEIPCFKALDPAHVVQALYSGFDGVLAVVCSEEDCKLEKGRETAERNMAILKSTLEKLGLAERFELYTVSPRRVGDFNRKLESFVEKIGKLPPLKLELPLQTV